MGKNRSGELRPEITILAGFASSGCALQKVFALFRSGNGTGIEAAPDAVANARNEAIDKIAQRTRDNDKDGADCGPGLWKLAQHGDDGARADQDSLGGSARVFDHEDRCGAEGGIVRSELIPGEEIDDLRRVG